MPASIDKNDVDISKLFNWGDKFSLEIKGDEYDVYIRLLGDAEVNKARVFALRKSAELRKKLRNKNSDERLAFIPTKDAITKTELIRGLLLIHTKDSTIKALREIKFNLPSELHSEATLEEREKYQEEIDAYPEKREMAIKEFVDEMLKEKEIELKKRSVVSLYQEYTSGIINQLCEAEVLTRYREMCAFYGTYTDENFSKRMFNDFAKFDNIHSDVKNQLVAYYLDLEMDGEILKK